MTTTTTDPTGLVAALDGAIVTLRDVTSPEDAAEKADLLAGVEAAELSRTKNTRTPVVKSIGAAVIALRQAAKGAIDVDRAVRNATGYLRDAQAAIGAGS